MRENVVGELYLDGIRVDTGGALGSTRYINGLKELYLGGTPIGFDAKHVTVSNVQFPVLFCHKDELTENKATIMDKTVETFYQISTYSGYYN